MLIDFLVIIAGIAGMLILARVIISNAVDLAHQFRLSGTFIGLTILSIGTSIPELMSHVVGSLTILRHPETMNPISGLLIGTNIGSDIFQQNFILPVVGLVGTVAVTRKKMLVQMGALIAAAVIAWFFCLGGTVSRIEGVIMVLVYAAYLVYLTEKGEISREMNAVPPTGGRSVWLSSLLIVVCFATMALVTEYVVVASTTMVALLPVSASFFGVVFLGVSTSLPELSTALVSMNRGQGDISTGIMIGSNITNPLLGIGLGAVISRYTVPDVVVLYDLPVNIATALILFTFFWRGENLTKLEASILLLLFFVYLYGRWSLFPEDFPAPVQA